MAVVLLYFAHFRFSCPKYIVHDAFAVLDSFSPFTSRLNDVQWIQEISKLQHKDWNRQHDRKCRHTLLLSNIRRPTGQLSLLQLQQQQKQQQPQQPEQKQQQKQQQQQQ